MAMSDVVGLEVSALRLHLRALGADLPGHRGDEQLHGDDVRRGLHGSIAALRTDVARLGELVETAVVRSVAAAVERDAALAGAVVRGDADCNALQLRIRGLCHSILMTQSPVCSDLRAVLAALQMSSELERMGDHCVSIAKQAAALADLPPIRHPAELSRLGLLCAAQVHEALLAALRVDEAAARAVAARDDEVDILYHRLVEGLVARMRTIPAEVLPATALVLIAHHLERIGDRVTNLAEEIVFQATGELPELG